ncbi:MAG: siroheme synthase [Candidatus Ozemobacter sibiricus]|jgi:uroporphyrin-III C-methyltransferase/precorrin-2 dehydrogenase/sirohydrochlorin ferrochelatase|uniref:precorrin-2 dehydrogenase n=1 Tax=Candidatus Ozemobacter sibiricus TaxID=2268124 RepID=A0A367ZRY0_9BACT|nr:MAG: siroheme synthase [Candidatus Ozemobacter sibiricus]
MDYLPVFLNLRGRLVLIVGGGEVALRKARLLHEAGARLRVVAPRIAPEFTDLTADLHRRPAQVDDLAPDVDLVVLATDAPKVQAALQAAARARRIWCNRCDEPAASDVVTGSVCDRSPILAGVISSGCPGLSRLLAARFDAVISPVIVDLARLLVELRPRVKAHFPTPAARAAFWRRWTTEAVIARLEREGLATIRQELEKELASPHDRNDL